MKWKFLAQFQFSGSLKKFFFIPQDGNTDYWFIIHCCCSVAKSCSTFATPWTAAPQASLSFTISQRLLGFISLDSIMLYNHLILCHPLLLLILIFPSISVFSRELILRLRWPKYWSFSISLSNEYSGLISSRTDWFDLLEVQGTLKSLLQHHNSKASSLLRSDPEIFVSRPSES